MLCKICIDFYTFWFKCLPFLEIFITHFYDDSIQSCLSQSKNQLATTVLIQIIHWHIMQIVHRIDSMALNSKNVPFEMLFIMLGLLHQFKSQINERNSKSLMSHARNPFKLEYYSIWRRISLVLIRCLLSPIDTHFIINKLEIRFYFIVKESSKRS